MNKLAYSAGCSAANTTFKLSEYNWELTGRPLKEDAIKADNGRRTYGTKFNEPTRPNRDVSKAFDALNTTRNSDFLNEMGQGLIGVTGGG